jgi:hypothetical protein
MLFNFRLAPLDMIEPWGSIDSPTLHWFGLTDGVYWIEVGDQTLFEYTPQVREQSGIPRYCHYQVVRLHEDVLRIFPHAMEPVPAAFRRWIAADHDGQWPVFPDIWYEHRPEPITDDEYWAVIESASAWIDERTLQANHLSPPASIRLWSDDRDVHIEWNNRDKLIDGAPAFTALAGRFSLPRADFEREVRSFHDRLMDEMTARIESIIDGALDPGIGIGLAQLAREHAHRRSMLRSLSTSAGTDWAVVAKAIAEIERD